MKHLAPRSVRHAFATGLAACSLAAGGAGDAPRTLRHDPFALPPALRAPLVATLDVRATPEPPAAPPWQPRLGAVVVAASGSMALVDGSVVVLGEELNGHRLVHVGERSATFVRNGVRVELKMDSASAAAR